MRHSIAAALICAGLAGCSEPHRVEAVCPPPESDVIVIVHISTGLVFFDSGSAQLDQRAVDYLDRMEPATWFSCADAVAITGHADRVGSAASNLELSLRRAETVRNALVARGVPDSLLSVHGAGETDPFVPTADGVARPENRRVEILPY
ncbi:OmpA family protein [Inquilinus sp. OTU3971]|uniref:OmpA family protein n=1 Tax=Inquilinus sp. OTU3971 TaxID=3043855 RepID=UPI00313C990D